MIFVTVGSQIPFDRLLCAVDEWAGMHKDVQVVAQAGAGKYKCRNIESHQILAPEEYNWYFKNAEVVVAHAGTGVTLTAAEYGVPLIMMPRQVEKGELRNNHQMDYMQYFGEHPGIYPAYNSEDLSRLLDLRGELDCVKAFGGNSRDLVEAIREHIFS